MVTVQVADTAMETVFLLDTGTAALIPKALLEKFDERLRWQAHGAAFVPGSELREYGDTTSAALTAAKDIIRRELHLGGDVRLFGNGVPRPHLLLDAIPVESIENVEPYMVRGKVTNTLALNGQQVFSAATNVLGRATRWVETAKLAPFNT
jgi:hypothetical protein